MAAMQSTLAIALAGVAGVLARYGIDTFVGGRVGTEFPWGTVLINVAGCFLAGLVWTVLSDRPAAPEWLRPALSVGFLGGFTTFSSFALQSLLLLEAGSYGLAGLNIVGSVTAGLTAAWAGAWLGRAA